MRLAIAMNNVVVNIIDAPSVAVGKAVYPGATVFDAAGVALGWVKQGSGWVPPTPVVMPAGLTHLQFILHVQDVGGVSDADLVAAKADPNLAAFWLKFDMATSLERDNPTTQAGLQALVMTGHLTEQARQAVIDEWPSA